MSRLVLDYDPIRGEATPDGRIHRYVTDIISTSQNPNITSDIIIIIGSVVIFDAFRVAIKEKRLNYKDVTVRFEGKDYEFNSDGTISNWPPGLCYIYDDILDRLL